MSADTPRFAVGDRVTYRDENAAKTYGAGMVIGLSTTDYNGVLVAWKHHPDKPVLENAVHLVLVARAHYAPADKPDAVPVWMTPDDVKALQAYSDTDTYAYSQARREGWQWPTPPPKCRDTNRLNALIAQAVNRG